MNKFSEYEILIGSGRSAFNGEHAGRPHLEQEIDITVLMRRSKPLNPMALVIGHHYLSRSMLEFLYSAEQADIDLLIDFANHFGLLVVRIYKELRTAILRSTIEQMEKAFGVQLALKYKGGRVHRTRTGPILIPKELSGVVVGVFGLDERPQAVSHLRRSKDRIGAPVKPAAFDGNQLAHIYDFPSNNGAGQTIALIELSGGFNQLDIQAFFLSLGLPCPTVKSVCVGGGANAPGVDSDADIEVALDIEVAGAVSPGSTIVVYFAPNTDQGFLQAILTAVHDRDNKPGIISISWGAAESEWTQQSLTAMNDAFQEAASLGISVFCAAGDSGCSDNVNDGKCHVDFPASSPWVTGCGGTTMIVNSNSRQETVWNDSDGNGASGGGISDVFDRPSYQQSIPIPPSLDGIKQGRGVPDVSAVADPETGYAVFVDALWNVVGGTSAVAPLFAGLAARVNQQLGRLNGLINAALYGAGAANGFNDITSGNNGYEGVQGYSASPGWDPVTGWGSPDGDALLKLLSSPSGPTFRIRW